MGAICEIGTGYPGYSSVIPRSAATVAEILRLNGYNTAMFGKNHLTRRVPWIRSQPMAFDGPNEKWELYNIVEDFSQKRRSCHQIPAKAERAARSLR